MSIRLIRRLAVSCAVLMLLAAPIAHAKPRAAVPGDNHDAPLAIAINGSKTVKNIQNATEEAGGYEEVSCDAGMESTNSVWFTFTLPDIAILDIDTGGSLLNLGPTMTTSVSLALYSLEGGLLNEESCKSGYGARLTDQSIPAGTYIIRIGKYLGAPMAGASQYRLSIRARYYQQLLTDPSFDNNPLGTVWKVKKAGSPAQISLVCSGGCHVRFNGAAKGQIAQTTKIASAAVKIKAGDLLKGTAFLQGTPPGGSDVKIGVVISYSDGTPATSASTTVHVTQTDTTPGGPSTPVGVMAEIASKAVKSVTVSISSPTASDTFNVVNTFLQMYAGTSVRADGVLPVPPSP